MNKGRQKRTIAFESLLIECIARGMNDQELANKFALSVSSIKFHLGGIYRAHKLYGSGARAMIAARFWQEREKTVFRVAAEFGYQCAKHGKRLEPELEKILRCHANDVFDLNPWKERPPAA